MMIEKKQPRKKVFLRGFIVMATQASLIKESTI